MNTLSVELLVSQDHRIAPTRDSKASRRDVARQDVERDQVSDLSQLAQQLWAIGIDDTCLPAFAKSKVFRAPPLAVCRPDETARAYEKESAAIAPYPCVLREVINSGSHETVPAVDGFEIVNRAWLSFPRLRRAHEIIPQFTLNGKIVASKRAA
ncbi:hypothetical protein GCM10027405_25000 [Arthrobacter alkaliphilus]